MVIIKRPITFLINFNNLLFLIDLFFWNPKKFVYCYEAFRSTSPVAQFFANWLNRFAKSVELKIVKTIN